MQKKTWIAVSATSVLGLGLLAGGATAAANAMTLTEGSTGATVPGLNDVTTDVKGSGQSADVSFSVQSDSIVTPSPATAVSVATPVSAQSVQSPVSVPDARVARLAGVGALARLAREPRLGAEPGLAREPRLGAEPGLGRLERLGPTRSGRAFGSRLPSPERPAAPPRAAGRSVCAGARSRWGRLAR